MADPLTALMYAVQVMNFLKMLILKTLRERKDAVVEPPVCYEEPSDEHGHQSPSQSCREDTGKENGEKEQSLITEEPILGSSSNSNHVNNLTNREASSSISLVDGDGCCDTAAQVDSITAEIQGESAKIKPGESSISNFKMGPKSTSDHQPVVWGTGPVEKNRGISNLSCIDSRMERIEAWR